ncbi:MAG: hypothetical protein HRU09_00190 [Oligoflexales bacterium]|nr:hypothetical protein [Oligoflexales bacterium]
MRVISISAKQNPDKPPFILRFQQGTGSFQNSYFLVGDNNLYQNVNQALSFAVLGPESGIDYYESSLIIADDAGVLWELRRRKNKYIILRNNETKNISISDYFKMLTESGKSLPFSIGRYHFTKREDCFYIAPLNHHNEEDQMVYRFISSHINKILEACHYSFGSDSLGQQHILESLCEKLEPVYSSYLETVSQMSTITNKKDNKPRDTAIEIDELKKQVNLMQKIANLTNEILDANPSLENLRKQLRIGENKIQKNLETLKIPVVPKSTLPPDWNVPLQCLCYLNVLDRVIPLLKQSLEQIQNHFNESIKFYEHDSKEFHEIRSRILAQLKSCRETIHRKNSVEKIKEISPEEESSIWHQIKLITGKKQNKNEAVSDDLGSIIKSLDETIYTLHNINPPKQFSETAPKTLEEFLKQSISKRETLIKHWQKICADYQIDESISLHEFLQFILRYNELFIIMQKSKELNTEIKSRGVKFGKLQKLLYEWYETIGSQKMINLDNPQIILSEAQNVIRYQKEKQSKLALIEANQLEIEVNLQIRNSLDAKLEGCQEEWNKQFKKLDLKNPIPISDARIAPLFEKFRLLKSLTFLQNHITSLKIFPAFSKDWVYETFCVWRIPLINMDSLQVDRLISCLKNLPDSARHILFFRDSELSAFLRGAGLGQITAFVQQKSPKSDAGNHFEDQNGEKPNPTPTLSPSFKEKDEKPRPSKPLNLDPVSPRVKAVIDLLNGNNIKG